MILSTYFISEGNRFMLYIYIYIYILYIYYIYAIFIYIYIYIYIYIIYKNINMYVFPDRKKMFGKKEQNFLNNAFQSYYDLFQVN